MNEAWPATLRKLRLSGMAQSLEARLQEAGGNGLNDGEFLELTLQDEPAVRAERLVNRRFKAAAFPELETLEDFEFSFNPSIRRKQLFELARCKFIRQRHDLLLLGPPGAGKSHRVQPIRYQAIKAGHVVLYRSIFDRARDFLHDDACARSGKGAGQVSQTPPPDCG